MKNKLLLLCLVTTTSYFFSQSNFTYAQCIVSKNEQVIAGFLKQHPNHPKTKILQNMLAQLKSGQETSSPNYIRTSNFLPSGTFAISNNNNSRKPEFANMAIAGTNTSAVAYTGNTTTGSSSGASASAAVPESAESAAGKLNYLLNDNTNSNMAFIAFKNNSNCPITVSITGSKAYSVTIPAMSDNNILVEKGTYQLNSKICKARYKKSKEITGDIQITLKD